MVKILEIELENVKSITSGRAKFVDGVNFIHGPNGAGKSTILDAIAFTLYGSDWLRRVRLRLADLVRIGNRIAIFRMKILGNNGKAYLIQRVITPEKSVEASTYVVDESGKRVASRDKEVTAFIEKITGIPISVFTELLYVRQGEIRDILELTRRGEQKLDKLLKLEAIDKLRNDYLREVKKRIEVYLRNYEGKLSIVERELNIRKKELENTQNEINKLKIEINEIKSKLEEIKLKKKEIEQYIQELQNLERKLSEVDALVKVKLSEIEKLQFKLIEINEKLQECNELIKDVERLKKLFEKCNEFKLRYEELLKNRNEVLEKLIKFKEIEVRLSSLNNQAQDLENRINDLEFKLQEIQKLKSRKVEIEFELNKLKDLEKELESKRSKLYQLNALKQLINKEIEILKNTKDKCPLCGNPLTSEKLRSILSKKLNEIKKLDQEINLLKNETSIIEKNLEKKDELIEELYRINSLMIQEKDLLNELNNLKMKFNEIINEIEVLNKELKLRNEIENRLKSIEIEINKLKEECDKCREIENELKEKESKLAEIEFLKNLKNEIEIKLKELSSEVSNLQDEYSKINQRITELMVYKVEFDNLCKIESDLNSRLSIIQGKLQSLEELKSKLINDISRFENEKKKIEELIKSYVNAYSNVIRIIDLLDKIKPKIRKKFIELLNQELNDMFLEVRHKSAFIGIRVNENYEIFVKRSDGVELNVESLSIGEKNLIALLFRYALAKVILGNVPIFILDEPTEHLDDEHRKRISQWIRNLANNVDLVLITSHVDAFETIADNLVKVHFINEKGEATFRNI